MVFFSHSSNLHFRDQAIYVLLSPDLLKNSESLIGAIVKHQPSRGVGCEPQTANDDNGRECLYGRRNPPTRAISPAGHGLIYNACYKRTEGQAKLYRPHEEAAQGGRSDFGLVRWDNLSCEHISKLRIQIDAGELTFSTSPTAVYTKNRPVTN